MPVRYPTDALLDAALKLYVDGGVQAVTMAGVARAVGAPSGSLYHRFDGRSELLARLWLRTVRRFQECYLDALSGDDDGPLEAAHRAVQQLLDWIRAHPEEALLLSRYSTDDLVDPEAVSKDVRERCQRLDEQLRGAMSEWSDASEADISTPRMRLALVDLPLAAVRPYLRAGEQVPDEIDALVHDALNALLPN